MIIHLGQQLPAASSNLPGNLGRAALNVSLFGLAPDGVYHAFPVAGKAVSSYLAFSPLPRKRSGRYIFCGTFL